MGGGEFSYQNGIPYAAAATSPRFLISGTDAWLQSFTHDLMKETLGSLFIIQILAQSIPWINFDYIFWKQIAQMQNIDSRQISKKKSEQTYHSRCSESEPILIIILESNELNKQTLLKTYLKENNWNCWQSLNEQSPTCRCLHIWTWQLTFLGASTNGKTLPFDDCLHLYFWFSITHLYLIVLFCKTDIEKQQHFAENSRTPRVKRKLVHLKIKIQLNIKNITNKDLE